MNEHTSRGLALQNTPVQLGNGMWKDWKRTNQSIALSLRRILPFWHDMWAGNEIPSDRLVRNGVVITPVEKFSENEIGWSRRANWGAQPASQSASDAWTNSMIYSVKIQFEDRDLHVVWTLARDGGNRATVCRDSTAKREMCCVCTSTRVDAIVGRTAAHTHMVIVVKQSVCSLFTH